MATGTGVWGLYGVAGRAAAPLARPYLKRRATRGKEDPARVDEKRGIPSRPPFDAPPVWVHAVSAGESRAALSVAERLAGRGCPILFTTATPTAAALVARSPSRDLVHQYAPLDAPQFVNRFLDHWRPRAAILTESEVWPTTLFTLARRSVPRAHVNARLSERSFIRWQRRRRLARPLFGAIDLVLAQSALEAERFVALGSPDVRVTGNLKFDAPPLQADPRAAGRLAALIGTRPVWLAASTHPGEEEAVLAAHAHAAGRLDGLCTILAPRHPERAEAVVALAARAGLHVARASRGEAPGDALYLVDTFGALGTVMALAPVVFLGGSLVPLGGHNPAEPAAHGCALLTGPHHGAMFEPFRAGGAARIVVDGEALGAAVAELLSDPHEREAMAARATSVLNAERGALSRTLESLHEWLGARPAVAP